ncbi:C-C motif chemokine 36.1 [Cololabis saira]|uniref:C-C motif chemokine 36.1 n=1 Tax=Cololabis saira TaxID=129043 RepID=UPI002AD30002|nr:C-C motif chemokine 36.1 [Cololabis saira]
MRTTHILLLCVLAAALLHTALANNGTGPDECCFKFYPRRLKKSIFATYHMTDHRCSKTGAILVTKKGRHICGDPNSSWVESVMKSLDEES